MFRFFSLHLEQLNRSFAAAYALLERPKVARRAVVLLLAIQTGLLAYSAYAHSPTLNEPGHLVAGLSYWKFGRFDVYNVNPPLVKMVAALPVMAVGYEEDWSGFNTGLGARPEFVMGEDFVAANGERSFFLFMIARWACIPFSWLGGVVCYLWARDLFGRPSGVIACAIWCFEPNILAHSSLITSDVAGAALGVAACYTFWGWLKKPTWAQAALTGVVLGLAELTKTTLILFYPLWPLMWAIYRWSDRHSMVARDWLREAGMLTARMLIGLYVLNLGYGFEGSLIPLGEFQFVSNLFTGHSVPEPTPLGEKARDVISMTPDLSHPTFPYNRFANSSLNSIPIILPANYLLGIDMQQKDFEYYGRPSYLRGEWSDRGWWYYYLYAAAIKVPLGLLMLGALTFITAIRPNAHRCTSTASSRSAHFPPPTSYRDLFILLFSPLVVFVVVSSKTGFSEHMRYVLPCFPFAFIWVSGMARNLLDKALIVSISCRNIGRRSLVGCAQPAVLMMLLWGVTSSLWIYPHSLSYFNEVIGGPLHGPSHLLGSSVDWGQDLRYLEEWFDANSESSASLVYVGGFAPSDIYGTNSEVPDFKWAYEPKSGLPPILADRLHMRSTHRWIISVACLEGSKCKAYDLYTANSRRFKNYVGDNLHLFRKKIRLSYCYTMCEVEPLSNVTK